MIVVTGAAGFIGSVLLRHLNEHGVDDVVIVDDFPVSEKIKNLTEKKYREQLHRDHLFDWKIG